MATTHPSPPASEPQLHRQLPIRQLAGLTVTLASIAFISHSLALNNNMQWSIVGRYFASPEIMSGLVVTLELTVGSQIIATVLGIALAMLGQSHSLLLRSLSRGYIWLFRATPLLVQLLFWYNIALVFPSLSFGIPFTTLHLPDLATSALISGLTASFLALGLNEAAYMAEIIRGGILAVPKGQIDAARSIGMRNGAVYRRVILPQTVKSVIPPTGNQVIGLLKASSLVSVIGGGDLLTRAEYIYGQNFDVIPLLLVASLWYLLLVTLATIGQLRLERWVDTSRSDKTDRRQEQVGRRILTNLAERRGG